MQFIVNNKETAVQLQDRKHIVSSTQKGSNPYLALRQDLDAIHDAHPRDEQGASTMTVIIRAGGKLQYRYVQELQQALVDDPAFWQEKRTVRKPFIHLSFQVEDPLP